MLDEKVIAFLDGRYRKIEDCDEIKETTEEKLSRLTVDIAVIKTKLTFLQWIGGVVGSAVIGIAIKYLFGG